MAATGAGTDPVGCRVCAGSAGAPAAPGAAATGAVPGRVAAAAVRPGRVAPAGIRAVIFDKDGVLVDTEPEHERRLRTYLGECGIDCSSMPCLYGSNNEATWSWVEPRGLERRERLYQGFRARWREDPIPYARLLDPEAPGLLRSLRAAGLRVGLASSSPRWVIEDFLWACGLEDAFNAVLSGEECAATKPAPDVYLQVMDALDVAPTEALVVEDSPTGILAAHRAGAFVCAVPLPESVELDQSLADVRLTSLGALAGLLGL